MLGVGAIAGIAFRILANLDQIMALWAKIEPMIRSATGLSRPGPQSADGVARFRPLPSLRWRPEVLRKPSCDRPIGCSAPIQSHRTRRRSECRASYKCRAASTKRNSRNAKLKAVPVDLPDRIHVQL